jgi:WD40 repeat protein
MQVWKASTSAVIGLCFTPDGRGLVTGSASAAVWDIAGVPKTVRQFDSHGLLIPVAVSPCGRFLALWGLRLRVHDLSETGPPAATVLDDDALTNAEAMAFAPDGTEFAVPGFTPRQWAVPSWEVIRDDPPPEENPRRTGAPYETGGIAYSPDGRTIALSFAEMNSKCTRYDACIRLFDRATGRLTAHLRTTFGYAEPKGARAQVAFSPDGKVVAGNYGPVLGVVSVADGKEVARLKVGTKHIAGFCFTRDGSKIVVVSHDPRVRVFDARTWKETAGYEWKVGKLCCVAVSPDGLRMAAGSGTGKVVVWDVDA